MAASRTGIFFRGLLLSSSGWRKGVPQQGHFFISFLKEVAKEMTLFFWRGFACFVKFCGTASWQRKNLVFEELAMEESCLWGAGNGGILSSRSWQWKNLVFEELAMEESCLEGPMCENSQVFLRFCGEGYEGLCAKICRFFAVLRRGL